MPRDSPAMCSRVAGIPTGRSRNRFAPRGGMDMTNQASRIRVRRAIFHLLGMFVVSAGCQLDRESGLPPMTHLLHGRSSYDNGGFVQCAPGSGFHPTCWQTWHEGGMATRCGTSENVAVPAQHGLNGGNGLELPPTAGSMNPLPISEAVPAAFFTHGRVPQASADSGSPRDDNDCAHFAP